MSLAKRIIDILVSLVGLLILIPLMPIIALLIKLDSKGPVIYLVDRVGRDMKIFKMYKFRTMIETPVEVGESVSPQYDPRVTAFGRFLRRTKMNELPQFMNILKGEMTFVGPRPEAPDLAELYPEEAKGVFSVKPGLVGPATILGRNEEECFPPGVDVKKYYIEKILPNKVKLDLEYAENPTPFKDLRYIVIGVKETLIGMVSKKHIQDNRSQIYLLLSDLFLITCSYLFAYLVCFWSLGGQSGVIRPLMNLGIVILIRLPCNVHFGMYSSLIRFISYHEILGAIKGVTCGSLFLLLIAGLFGLNDYPASIAVIDWACLIFLICGFRFGLRFYWEKGRAKAEAGGRHRIMIYGACEAGNRACRVLALEKDKPYDAVGFIDDDPSKYGKTLNGFKVLGNRHHIKALAQLYKVKEILIAEPEANPDRVIEIMEICRQSDLKCRLFSSFKDLDGMSRHPFNVRNLELSDVLPLQEIRADHGAVKEIITGKTVLVNGSGGTLGLELCRRILKLGCKRLIIIDRYESYLNELVAGLRNGLPDEMIVPVLSDTGRIDILEDVFENYRPNLVFHAGMRKYVPFLPIDLSNLGRTNYLCTFTLAKLAAKFHCEMFVMISSLMAGKGGNLINDSLRIAEVSLEHFFREINTRLIIARICNIAENRGGIVSTIEDQIRNQETVVLPSEGAQTWLISKDSAAEFILQTLVEVKKNSLDRTIFACNAGSPIPLIEVTRKLANLYGLKLGSDLMVKYTGRIDGPDSKSPQKIPSSTYIHSPAVREARGNVTVTKEELKSVFKEFMLGENSKSSLQDWKAQTRKLIKLCESESPLPLPC